ncbi:MAG: cellulase family glycosylhydrolase [Cyanobacteria bacterium P01_C01_bin.72]
MQTNNYNFQILEGKIYDPNGQEFIIKGANIFTWEGIKNVDNYLNTWSFNTVRIPNYLLGSYEQPHPEEDNYGTNHKFVDAYTSQGAVVIFDAHDRIGGYYEDAEWKILKDYWRDMAREFKDNPHVWLNLHNEPGNAIANTEKWVSYHRELIDIIRAEGANNLIVVDGEAWGQDHHTQTIANSATEIMAGNENILFSVHVYEQWNSNDLGVYFDALHDANIPFIVGEYGSSNNEQSTLAATQQMFAATQESEIGRVVWNAKSDDNNDLTSGEGGHAEYFDGINTGILTELGELVWNDLQRTENLEQLAGYEPPTNHYTFTDGVFQVDESGEIKFDFLFDGGWFQGELGIFNLAGMETYTPGSIEFIEEATTRALSNSEQGYIVLQDQIEGARFSSQLPWENDWNSGEYLGKKTFNLTAGSNFALISIQDATIQEIANSPNLIWQDGKLPIFSIPEANFGTAEEQIAAIDNHGTYALEDVRVDWQESDRDYNDLIFQLQGATSIVPMLEDLVDPTKDWRATETGQNILEYAANSTTSNGETGVFTVDSTGQIQFDFLFDGGWFQGELAMFSLAGMEAYVPGSQAFIQEAANRALTDSQQGHILMRDRSEGANFSSPLPWEKDFNAGEYLGQKSWAMNPGDQFALMLVQHTTVQDLAENPGSIWQWGKLPLFSLPEANPNGTGEGQMVEVDSNGTFAFEDVRVDFGDADGDYNDVVFQIQGAAGVADSMDELVNPERDWRTTEVGQDLLTYAANNSLNSNTAIVSASLQTIQHSSITNIASPTIATINQELPTTISSSDLQTEKNNNNNQTVRGGMVNDTLIGGKGNDTLKGGRGNDKLRGKSNDDQLFGNQGNDLLFGNRGNDILIGGKGNDTLIGGKGNDLFVLAQDKGVDLIKDFELGKDLIQLWNNLQFADLSITQGNGKNSDDVMITVAQTDQLLAVINDVIATDLAIVDFI